MAIYIDWPNSIIHVAKADMVLVQSVPSEIYQFDIDQFHLTLRDLEDNADGMVWLKTHLYKGTTTISGAVLAPVVEILEPYTVTFEDGQYRVLCVGANTNIGERVNVNQVSVSTSNSAGLQDLKSLQAASFDGVVAVDNQSQFSGTIYPIGTKGNPVNNIADAISIANTQNIDTLYFLRSHTLDTGDDVSGMHITSAGPQVCTITVNANALTLKSRFSRVFLTGNLDGDSLVEECSIQDLNYVNGFVYKTMLNPGTISLGGINTAHFLDCYSGVPGQSTPLIDMNGSGGQNTPLALRNYNGGIKLIDKDGDAACSIDLGSGQVIIDSTCTNGEVVVRGDGKVVDSLGVMMHSGTYNGNLALVNEATYGDHLHEMWVEMGLSGHESSTETFAQQVTNKIWDEQVSSHTTSGTFGAFIQKKLLTVSKFLGLK